MRRNGAKLVFQWSDWRRATARCFCDLLRGRPNAADASKVFVQRPGGKLAYKGIL